MYHMMIERRCLAAELMDLFCLLEIGRRIPEFHFCRFWGRVDEMD
jgi:hypothetical protein